MIFTCRGERWQIGDDSILGLYLAHNYDLNRWMILDLLFLMRGS